MPLLLSLADTISPSLFTFIQTRDPRESRLHKSTSVTRLLPEDNSILGDSGSSRSNNETVSLVLFFRLAGVFLVGVVSTSLPLEATLWRFDGEAVEADGIVRFRGLSSAVRRGGGVSGVNGDMGDEGPAAIS